jgi:hypothetical protein
LLPLAAGPWAFAAAPPFEPALMWDAAMGAGNPLGKSRFYACVCMLGCYFSIFFLPKTTNNKISPSLAQKNTRV